MSAYKRRKRKITITVAGIILTAYLLRVFSRGESPTAYVLSKLRSLLYILLFTGWGISIRRRIIQKQTQRHLLFISLMMVFLIGLRTVKYHLVTDYEISHWLWYFYYLPFLLIPLLMLYVSQSICRSEDYRLSDRILLLYLPMTVLLGAVLTNDIHQLVFRFYIGTDANPYNNYYYGPLYYAIVFWIAFCFIVSVFTFFKRSRLADRTSRIRSPILILTLLGFYSVLYGLHDHFVKVWLSDFTVVFCLLLMEFFESLFRLNLIQNNTMYKELFSLSSIPAIIVDESLNEVIHTGSYRELPKEDLEKAKDNPIDIEQGKRLSGVSIKDGFVFYEEDISKISELAMRLKETEITIEEENEAQLQAYRAQKQHHRLKEQNRLYDKLQSETRNKVEELSTLLDELEKSDSESEAKILLRISVIGAYLKRRSNLSFLSEDGQPLSAHVLKNCLEQSLDCLTLFDIENEMDFRLKEDLSISSTIRLYELFETVVEATVETLREMYVVFTEDDDAVRMVLRLYAETDLSVLSTADFSVEMESDNEWVVTCVQKEVRL